MTITATVMAATAGSGGYVYVRATAINL